MIYVIDTETNPPIPPNEHWVDYSGVVYMVTHVQPIVGGTEGRIVCDAGEYPPPIVVTARPVSCLRCLAVLDA